MTSSTLDSFSFFPGWVPPFVIFRIYIENLETIVQNTQKSDNAADMVPELCTIGLVAYFEAFCKAHFATLINVCPSALKNFVQRRPDVTIKVKDFLNLAEHLEYRLGSVLADEYDFGTAKQINGLFGDLINRTPFSTDEAAVYSRLLNDRNLLVHHGGSYTLKYAYQNFPSSEIPSKVFDYGIRVVISDVLRAAEFLRGIGKKLTVTSRDALVEFAKAEGLSMTDAQVGALNMMSDDDWNLDQHDDAPKSS